MNLINILLKIAEVFNRNNVTWAVGGSLLLYYYDILDSPNDIDIIIDPKDEAIVFEIMNKLGIEKPSETIGNYKTGVFGKFDVSGVEVDIIGDFFIKSKKGYYLHPFPPKELKIIKENNIEIFLDSLENWLETYRAMGDPKNRVKLIDGYLNNEKGMC